MDGQLALICWKQYRWLTIPCRGMGCGIPKCSAKFFKKLMAASTTSNGVVLGARCLYYHRLEVQDHCAQGDAANSSILSGQCCKPIETYLNTFPLLLLNTRRYSPSLLMLSSLRWITTCFQEAKCQQILF